MAEPSFPSTAESRERRPAPRCLQPHADVVAQEVGGELILAHLRTNAVYALNPTGAQAWRLLAAGYDTDDIVRRFAAEFDVRPERLGGELEELIDGLLAAELLVDEHDRRP